MASNRGVAYIKPGVVEIQSIDYPELALGHRKCDHGVILKIVSTNICGSDQHMVRGRTTAPEGLILGHEITGEVLEAGRDVEFVEVGDLVSVPFNIAHCFQLSSRKSQKEARVWTVIACRPIKSPINRLAEFRFRSLCSDIVPSHQSHTFSGCVIKGPKNGATFRG